MNSTALALVVNGSVITVPLVGLLDPNFTGNVTDHDRPVLAPSSAIHASNLGDLATPALGPSQPVARGQGRRLTSAGALLPCSLHWVQMLNAACWAAPCLCAQPALRRPEHRLGTTRPFWVLARVHGAAAAWPDVLVRSV